MATPRNLDIFNVPDSSLYKVLRIPECLHDVMTFVEVKFVPKDRVSTLSVFSWSQEKLADPTNWILTLPTNVPGKRVEIPINDPIDKEDPEGHWRAILGAAADFQALVNTGQYDLA
jgi:hypothetical protein